MLRENHHHHVVPQARISLTLSRHFSLSLIASGWSSGLHPVSSRRCCMYVRAGCPAFVRPYVGVHRSTSLMSSSQLLQQCSACLVRLTWIVFVIGGRWPYSWCLVGCCHQDLFNIARRVIFPNEWFTQGNNARTDYKMAAWKQACVETTSANPYQSYSTTVGEKIKKNIVVFEIYSTVFLIIFCCS